MQISEHFLAYWDRPERARTLEMTKTVLKQVSKVYAGLRERNETKIEWTRPFDNNYTKLPCGGVVCGGNQNSVGLQIVVTV